jgi:putative intracellular protease/amidase
MKNPRSSCTESSRYKVYLLLLFLVFISVYGCSKNTSQLTSDPTTDNDKNDVLMLVPQEKFNDDEFSTIKTTITDHQFDVTVASTTKNVIVGMFSIKAFADASFDHVDIDKYEGIILIGGVGYKELDNHYVKEIIDVAFKEDKIIGAIGQTPIYLSSHMQRRNMTLMDTHTDEISSDVVLLLDKVLVTDGNVITANGPGTSEEFAMEFIKKLKEI